MEAFGRRRWPGFLHLENSVGAVRSRPALSRAAEEMSGMFLRRNHGKMEGPDISTHYRDG
jgi:hypothetical protein